MKKILFTTLILVSSIAFANEKCEYKVISIEGYPTIKDNQPTLNFNKERNSIYGRASCNSYFGSYKKDGDNISFSDTGSTLMACFPNSVMEQETKYMKVLSEVKSKSPTKDGDIYLDKDFNKLFETKKCD